MLTMRAMKGASGKDAANISIHPTPCAPIAEWTKERRANDNVSELDDLLRVLPHRKVEQGRLQILPLQVVALPDLSFFHIKLSPT